MTSCRINFFIFDNTNAFVDRFSLIPSKDKQIASDESTETGNNELLPEFDASFDIDGYCLSVFHNILTSSANYRNIVKKKLLNIVENIPAGRHVNVCLRLVPPKSEFFDYGWNDRIERLLLERQELEHSMSWLSTLGGAFSALGDNIDYCAQVAGKISVQQLQIALRLDEPPLMARCKLYMALSLIQQKNLKLAKKIIEDQYQLAKDFKDFRLINMCKGIWAKLQYTHKLEQLKKKLDC